VEELMAILFDKEINMMKIERNIKQLCWMPIFSFLGIIIGIVVANFIHENIGIGISMGWAIGFLAGAIFSFVVSQISKKRR
jgi:MFS family permease